MTTSNQLLVKHIAVLPPPRGKQRRSKQDDVRTEFVEREEEKGNLMTDEKGDEGLVEGI